MPKNITAVRERVQFLQARPANAVAFERLRTEVSRAVFLRTPSPPMDKGPGGVMKFYLTVPTGRLPTFRNVVVMPLIGCVPQEWLDELKSVATFEDWIPPDGED